MAEHFPEEPEPAHPISSSFRSVAGQEGGGRDGEELAGGIISGGGGRRDTGGVTMMPGADRPVSAAGGACGSGSALRHSAQIRLPSAKAADTMKSVFIRPISLRRVSLYRDRTNAARELLCRVARPTQKHALCPGLMAPAIPQRARMRAVGSALRQANRMPHLPRSETIRESLCGLKVTATNLTATPLCAW
jgi:hypothetical protein